MHQVRRLVEGNFSNVPDGSGVVIAVLDIGLGNQPDLAGRLLCFQNFVGHRRMVYDDNGHGAHVCGLKNNFALPICR